MKTKFTFLGKYYNEDIPIELVKKIEELNVVITKSLIEVDWNYDSISEDKEIKIDFMSGKIVDLACDLEERDPVTEDLITNYSDIVIKVLEGQ